MRESFSCLHEIGMNGYTPASLVRLTAKNLKQDESGDWLIVVRDKGGKDSIQLILPEEVDFVRETLSKDKDGKPLKGDERPFSSKDRKQMALGNSA